MKAKKKYVPMTIEVLKLETEGCFLVGSKVETIQKDMTVKTDNYELENEDWFNSTISFE